MKRKTFIYLSVTGAIATGLTFLYSHKPVWQLKSVLGKPEFLSHICDKKTILDIGKAYRLWVPAESDIDRLADMLTKDDSGDSIQDKGDSSSVQVFVNQNIGKDFKTGHTLVVSGWVLSVTEARQCAFFSLV